MGAKQSQSCTLLYEIEQQGLYQEESDLSEECDIEIEIVAIGAKQSPSKTV